MGMLMLFGGGTFYPTDVTGRVEFWDFRNTVDSRSTMVLTASDTLIESIDGPLGHQLFASGSWAMQPTLSASAPNGAKVAFFDGNQNGLHNRNATIDLSASNVVPTWYFGVVRNEPTTANFETLCGGGQPATNNMALQCPNSAVALQMGNGVFANLVTWTPGVWTVVEALFTGSVADYLVVHGVKVTGTSSGNTNPASGWSLGTRGDHNQATCIHASIGCFGIWNQEPSVADRNRLYAWASSSFGLT